MKAEFTFPPELVKEIAREVAELLKPMLSDNGKAEDDTIFDKKELSKYLNVPLTWVNKKVSFNEIPYFKAGKYPRFKKSAIDKWIDTQTVRAIPSFKLVKKIM
jgi:excisionase family DNA binding protein